MVSRRVLRTGQLAALLFALVAVVEAQIPFLGRCASRCTTRNVEDSGCSRLDVACQCSNSDYLNSVYECIKDGCDEDDAQSAFDSIQSGCGILGVEVPDGPTTTTKPTPTPPPDPKTTKTEEKETKTPEPPKTITKAPVTTKTQPTPTDTDSPEETTTTSDDESGNTSSSTPTDPSSTLSSRIAGVFTSTSSRSSSSSSTSSSIPAEVASTSSNKGRLVGIIIGSIIAALVVGGIVAWVLLRYCCAVSIRRKRTSTPSQFFIGPTAGEFTTITPPVTPPPATSQMTQRSDPDSRRLSELIGTPVLTPVLGAVMVPRGGRTSPDRRSSIDVSPVSPMDAAPRRNSLTIGQQALPAPIHHRRNNSGGGGGLHGRPSPAYPYHPAPPRNGPPRGALYLQGPPRNGPPRGPPRNGNAYPPMGPPMQPGPTNQRNNSLSHTPHGAAAFPLPPTSREPSHGEMYNSRPVHGPTPAGIAAANRPQRRSIHRVPVGGRVPIGSTVPRMELQAATPRYELDSSPLETATVVRMQSGATLTPALAARRSNESKKSDVSAVSAQSSDKKEDFSVTEREIMDQRPHPSPEEFPMPPGGVVLQPKNGMRRVSPIHSDSADRLGDDDHDEPPPPKESFEEIKPRSGV